MGKRRPHARRHLSSRRHAGLPGPSLPGSAPASPGIGVQRSKHPTRAPWHPAPQRPTDDLATRSCPLAISVVEHPHQAWQPKLAGRAKGAGEVWDLPVLGGAGLVCCGVMEVDDGSQPSWPTSHPAQQPRLSESSPPLPACLGSAGLHRT
ncbi:hypothetical protein ACCO45_004192 [Purpureocillium lilacinum]|uniref:Uncharacterized protein n=1 Tax=Purpureocillium lilacinum TaxID=33203 RepID=A0ACC4E4J0_PURLI